MEASYTNVLPIFIRDLHTVAPSSLGESDRGQSISSVITLEENPDMSVEDDAALDPKDFSSICISTLEDVQMLEESTELARVFSASHSEFLELHYMMLQCPWSSLSLAGAFSGANRLLVVDLQTQLYGLRKACSVLTSACPPVQIWISVVRSICATVASLFFLSSKCLPVRCARFALGGVYRNALSACILSEVLDAVIAIMQFLNSPAKDVTRDNFIQYTVKKLALAVGGMICATAIPTPLLSGHLVLCISHVLVDMCVSSLKKTSATHLRYLLERLRSWQARVRLSAVVLDSRAIVEKTYSDESGEWTCSELTF